MAQGLQRGREPRARPVVGGLFDGPQPPEERRPEAQARFTCRAASGAVEARRAPECEIRVWIPEIAVPKAARAWLSRAAEVPHRSEEHTSELQSRSDLVCRLLLEKKKKKKKKNTLNNTAT